MTKTREKGKANKKQKSLTRLGKTFWHARTKNVTKRDAIAKKTCFHVQFWVVWTHNWPKNVQKCEFFKNLHMSMGAIGSYFSNFAPISSPGLLVMGKKLYRLTKILTDISINYRPTLDRYIERLSSDYRPSVDRPSTECWPSIDQLSAKSRPSVSEQKAISTETHLEWLSTVSRPSVGRLLTAISTDYRPSVDRYIDR